MGTENAERRRAELTDLVYRIVADHGVDAVSVRTVAQRAGVSIGTVQHYFPTKQAMLNQALELMLAQVRGRVAQEWTPPYAPRIRQVLLEVLPLDDVRRAETRVWLAFLTHETFAAEPSRGSVAASDQLEHALARALRACQESGELDPAYDAEQEASLLNALAEGLAYRGLDDPEHYPPARLTALLDAHLSRLLSSADTETR